MHDHDIITRRGLLGGALAAGGLAAWPLAADTRVPTREIPVTGEPLPVIGVGTAHTFDVGDDADAIAKRAAILRALLEGGATLVDTSPMYGSAEEVIGRAAQDVNGRERLFLATKVWTRGRQEGLEQMRRSLELLRVERVDLMQIHNLLEWRTHASTLRDWKERGLTRYIGLSHWRRDAYPEVIETLQSLRSPMDVLQINYSLLSPEAGRELIPLAADKGMAVLANRPFDNAEAFRAVNGHPLPPWALEFGVRSWADYFLRWTLANPQVTCVVAGTGNPEHMQANLRSAASEVPDAAMARRMREYVLSL